jgi:hypothetical protein
MEHITKPAKRASLSPRVWIRGHLRFCYPAAQKYPTAADQWQNPRYWADAYAGLEIFN